MLRVLAAASNQPEADMIVGRLAGIGITAISQLALGNPEMGASGGRTIYVEERDVERRHEGEEAWLLGRRPEDERAGVGDRAPDRREARVDVVEERRLEVLDGPVVRDERRRSRAGTGCGEEPARLGSGSVRDVARSLRHEERPDGFRPIVRGGVEELRADGSHCGSQPFEPGSW